jgi:capsid protein
MSKKRRGSRGESRGPQTAQLPEAVNRLAAELGGAQPVRVTPQGMFAIGTNGYQGAELSTKRGYVYFPQLDTRREIDSYTRTELLRRARFLYANVGLVRRIVNGMARMVVGTGLIPSPTTPDEAWNEEAKERFAYRYESIPVWDVGGRFDGYAQQRVMMQRRYLDGDITKVYTSSESGRARTILYEAHQVRNAGEIPEGQRWWDGVRVDGNNRAITYRIAGDGDSYVDVRPEDMVFFADFESPGRVRGLTVLYHAVNNLLDVTEIRSYLKHGIKISSQIGYYIAAKDANQPRGVQAAFGPSRTETVGEGTDKTTVENLYGSGRIPDIGYRELKTLLDERPHPNSAAFLSELTRDIAWGAGMSPELLWDIAALGGANTRFVLADAQGYIEQEQELLGKVSVKRDWNITIAKEIKYGGFREPRDASGRVAPGSWLGRVTVIPPKRLTVDYGRDGKLMLEMLRVGAMGHERWYEMQGQDAREETMKQLKFLAWRRDQALALKFTEDPLLDKSQRAEAGASTEDNTEEDPKKKGASQCTAVHSRETTFAP